MWKMFGKKFKGGQKGITGLETAIILIAFVIVASVFAYVVLSAGLFSSQKAKEAITSGLGSTMSVLQLKGDVIAQMNGGNMTQLQITVGIPSAGSPVDFSTTQNGTKMVIVSYTDDSVIIPSCNWTLVKLSSLNGDDLLDPNELFQIQVDLSTSGNGSVSIGPYHRFTVEIKPPDGPVLSIERTLPARVSQFVNLH
ncbi:MAG: archaellin/type IV pilin N-terminal domain-containing protein [Dehalococcoidales bacterium]